MVYIATSTLHANESVLLKKHNQLKSISKKGGPTPEGLVGTSECGPELQASFSWRSSRQKGAPWCILGRNKKCGQGHIRHRKLHANQFEALAHYPRTLHWKQGGWKFVLTIMLWNIGYIAFLGHESKWFDASSDNDESSLGISLNFWTLQCTRLWWRQTSKHVALLAALERFIWSNITLRRCAAQDIGAVWSKYNRKPGYIKDLFWRKMEV